MKIVFIGAVKFSEHVLAKLIKMKADVVGVCTLKESIFNSDHTDLTELCRANKIPVNYCPDINSDKSINWIQSLNPDVIFCFGWSRLIKTELLNMTKLGVIGYHPTKLPRNRGRHPIIWSIVLGFSETASTFFFMDEGADSGDILSQKIVKIFDTDNAETLYNKLIKTALHQVEKFVLELESNNYQRIKQDDKKANYWRKRGSKDGRIDWRMSAKSIHNLVRGLARPYPGADFEVDHKIVKVWKTEIVNNNRANVEPGKVIAYDKKGILVQTGQDSIKLLETEPFLNDLEGKYL